MANYIPLHSIIEQFRSDMISQGITAPEKIEADRTIHRFYINGDKPGTKNGWYVLYPNPLAHGNYGNWKGVSYSWRATNFQPITSYELRKKRQQIEKAKLARNRKRRQEHASAALQAEQIYYGCSSANPNHPYLLRKCIKPFSAHQQGKFLILPIKDCEGKLWSLQYISVTGSKRFLLNGAIAGNFIPIQHYPAEDIKILICEGFATGATLAEANPDACIIAACNAGNLEPVAVKIRHNLRNAEILICADDDRLTPDNPGITKGRAAAIASGSLFSKPNWPEGSPENLTDFNDLACWAFGMRGAK
ncbi:toprim domain-containing protein [Legionella sp. 31fI33]|uniref:toprim domain-containing protein n=1 Tax=Legionella sp. 31fI33 TaxID=2886376 RepID=UPI001E5D6192|nr:toprim domain-containing protein [Legionella sp. 31fI33]MCC5016057.1 toprim domain-containing protein [Legionella sp. 31fI33]